MKTETNQYKANQESKTLQCIKDYIYIYLCLLKYIKE